MLGLAEEWFGDVLEGDRELLFRVFEECNIEEEREWHTRETELSFSCDNEVIERERDDVVFRDFCIVEVDEFDVF